MTAGVRRPAPSGAPGRVAALLALIGLLLAPTLGTAEGPPPGVAIDEIFVDPDGGAGYIELVQLNPAVRLTLRNFYLATSPYYAELPAGVAPEHGVVARLPDVVVGPGERFVVALGSAEAFAARHGRAPDAVLPPGEPLSLEPALDDSTQQPALPDATSGVVVLFWWDGTTDRVLDADLVRFGSDPAHAIDKTGLAVDGPDADELATPYGADTPVGQQEPLGAPRDRALTRVAGELGEQVRSDANGLGGHDETSERWALSFAPTRLPTPGAPGVVAHLVSGAVRRATDGEPLPGATVRIAELGLSASADASGTFSLGPVPRGTWTLHIEAAGADPRRARFGFAVSDDDLDLDLELADTTVIGGRVALRGLLPPALAGTRVAAPALGLETTTDGDGDFALVGLPIAASVALEISRPGYVGVTAGIDTRTATRLELELREALERTVVVQLRGAEGPLPAGAHLVLEALDAPARRYEQRAPSGGEPRLELAGVLEGRYALRLTLDDHAPLGLEPLVIEGPQPTLTLEPVAATRDGAGTVRVGCTQAPMRTQHAPGGLAALGLLALLLGRRAVR